MSSRPKTPSLHRNKTLLPPVLAFIAFVLIASHVQANEEGEKLENGIEIDGVAFGLSGSVDWFAGNEPLLGGATVYSAPSSANPNNRSHMTGTIVGPAVVEYYARQHSSTYDLGGLHIDGQVVQHHYSEYEWKQYSYQIPPGEHTISFVVDDFHLHIEGYSPLRFADIRLIRGYQVNLEHPGGSVIISPEKESYDAGDIVTLTANPFEDNRFVSWGGDMESTDSSVQLEIVGHVNLSAEFEATTIGFGYDFQISDGVNVYWQNAHVRDQDRALMAVAQSGVKSYTISVKVDYGGTLSWDRVDFGETYTNSDKQTFHIGERFVTSFQRYFAPHRYSFNANIPSGTQELIWRAENSFFRGDTAFPMILENIHYSGSSAVKEAYELWVAQSQLESGVNDAPGDDPNEDGVLNITHFVFGTDPLSDVFEPIPKHISVEHVFDRESLAFTLPIHEAVEFYWDPERFISWSYLGSTVRIEASTDLHDFGDLHLFMFEKSLVEMPPAISETYRYRSFVPNVDLAETKQLFIRVSAE